MSNQTQQTEGWGSVSKAPQLEPGNPGHGRSGASTDVAGVGPRDEQSKNGRREREPVPLVPPLPLMPPRPLRPPSTRRSSRAGDHPVGDVSFIQGPRTDDARTEAEAEGERFGGSGPGQFADRATRRAEARRRRANDRVIRKGRGRITDQEAGMATAEYAIATLAAVGFAALLVAVLSSGEIKGLLMSLITSALSFG